MLHKTSLMFACIDACLVAITEVGNLRDRSDTSVILCAAMKFDVDEGLRQIILSG